MPATTAAPPSVASGAQTVYATGGSELLCLIGVLLFAAFGYFVWIRPRRAAKLPGGVRRSDPSDPYGSYPTSALEAEANTALVGIDDSIKTSEQELSFATAQYGPEATTAFGDALEQSRADVTEAFRLKQLLDDETPDDDPTRRDWFVQIIGRCHAASARLDAQAVAFDNLRALEANLETSIPALDERRAAAIGRLPAIAALEDDLRQRYAPHALLPIAGSAGHIEERLMFVGSALGKARTSLDAGQRSPAAIAVRASEDAVGQIDMLLDGVASLAADLTVATTSAQDMLGQVESDVAAGSAAVEASRSGGTASAGTVDLAAAVAGAEQVAGSVRAELAAPRPDPFHALRRLEQAGGRLNTALASIRDAATRVERARTALDKAIPAARAEISAVTNFITTRRGAVGSEARTRLAEAQRNLDQAITLADADPVAALTAAQQADTLASQAADLANTDVDGWSEPTVAGGFGMGGLGGAVLGGILIDSVLGGGRRGGFGGGGFSGGGFGTGFGWGGRTPGTFGGQRTRVRLRA